MNRARPSEESIRLGVRSVSSWRTPTGKLFVTASFALLSACASRSSTETRAYAEIDAVIADGCKAPSIEFREIRDEKSRKIKVKSMPLRLLPGYYSIGISCGVVYRSNVQSCLSAPRMNSEIPPYKLMLRQRVKYLFSCTEDDDSYDFRMVEKTL